MKTIKIIKDISSSIFTAFIFVFIPIIFITLLSSKTSVLGGLKSFTVLSGSMVPIIPAGSVVYTVGDTKFQIGEIITFERGGKNITHRIVDIVDKDKHHVSQMISPLGQNKKPAEIFYKTKGDANTSPDSDLVPANKIIGKTFTHIPNLGKLSYFLRSIPGFILFIILPTVTFIGFELWNIKKEIEVETEKKVLERIGAYG